VNYFSIESPRIISPPIPTAFDPLAINEGDSFDAFNSLDVSAVLPFAGSATFSWDLNGDGTFGDIPDQTGTDSQLLSFEITWEQLVSFGMDDDGTNVVGDGVIQTAMGDPTSLSHTYDGPATFVISATTTDTTSGVVTFAENVVVVNVANIAPVLTLSTAGPTTIDEGTTFTLDLDSSDPGADTLSSWAIDWGDGSNEVIVGNPSSLTHVYDDGPNVYTISATATDEDGTYAANTFGMTVNNVAPTLTVSGASTTDEGSVYTLTLGSSDPGDDAISSWEIDWGDGTGIQNIVGDPGSVTHTYADAGPSIPEPNFLHSSSSPVATIEGAPIQSTIIVNGVTGLLRDVDVTLNLTHADLTDLEIFLVGPEGTRVALVNTGTKMAMLVLPRSARRLFSATRITPMLMCSTITQFDDVR